MSIADPFRRPSRRQYELVAEAFVDFQDLLYGGPVYTKTKAGEYEIGDANAFNINAGSTGSGTSLSGIQFNLFELPAGAIVTGGDLKVLTAFNSATSDTLILGYTTAPGNEYLASTSIAAAARTALLIPNRQLTTTEKVLAKWTGAGAAPTAGRFHVTLNYIIPGRSFEVQGL